MENELYKICAYCLKPNIGDNRCDNCSSDEVAHSSQFYSVKQWEWFVTSLSGGCTHDFNPWEFDAETGRITRNDGVSGTIGPQGQKPPKRKYNNRKLTKARKKVRNG